ncbi:hypothetical protein SISNIDRAFT_454291, partial [Sistotremastrum niveocremeum HHB9708]
AAVTILIYDWLLTFDREVEYIWKENWNVGKVLYILNRYVPAIDLTIHLNAFLNPNVGPAFCRPWFYIDVALAYFDVSIVVFLLVLRTIAIWERSRPISLLISLTGLFTMLSLAVFVIIVSIRLQVLSYPYIPIPGLLTGCYWVENVRFTALVWTCPMVFEAVVFMLTFWKAVDHLRNNVLMHMPLFKALYRDGFLYFFMIFAIALANLILLHVASPALGQLLLMFYRAGTSVMASRIILNVRGVLLDSQSVSVVLGSTSASGVGFVTGTGLTGETGETGDTEVTEATDVGSGTRGSGADEYEMGDKLVEGQDEYGEERDGGYESIAGTSTAVDACNSEGVALSLAFSRSQSQTYSGSGSHSHSRSPERSRRCSLAKPSSPISPSPASPSAEAPLVPTDLPASLPLPIRPSPSLSHSRHQSQSQSQSHPNSNSASQSRTHSHSRQHSSTRLSALRTFSDLTRAGALSQIRDQSQNQSHRRNASSTSAGGRKVNNGREADVDPAEEGEGVGKPAYGREGSGVKRTRHPVELEIEYGSGLRPQSYRDRYIDRTAIADIQREEREGRKRGERKSHWTELFPKPMLGGKRVRKSHYPGSPTSPGPRSRSHERDGDAKGPGRRLKGGVEGKGKGKVVEDEGEDVEDDGERPEEREDELRESDVGGGGRRRKTSVLDEPTSSASPHDTSHPHPHSLRDPEFSSSPLPPPPTHSHSTSQTQTQTLEELEMTERSPDAYSPHNTHLHPPPQPQGSSPHPPTHPHPNSYPSSPQTL